MMMQLILTAVHERCWNTTGIVVDFRVVDVLNDSVGDVLALRWIVASHPKRRKICGDEIVARFVVDQIVVEPCASFFVPENFFDGLKKKFQKYFPRILLQLHSRS